MFLGISNSLHLLDTPSFFIAGETARQIVPLPLLESATTRFALKGSKPLSTHSQEAKKLLRSIHA